MVSLDNDMTPEGLSAKQQACVGKAEGAPCSFGWKDSTGQLQISSGQCKTFGWPIGDGKTPHCSNLYATNDTLFSCN